MAPTRGYGPLPAGMGALAGAMGRAGGEGSKKLVPTAQGPPRMELSPCPGAVRKQE